jgi:type I restriction enzyme S subunit
LENGGVAEVTPRAQTAFKDTEIGPIPVDWNVVRLGRVASFNMGQSPPSSTYNVVGEGLPFLQGKAEFGRIYPTPIKWCSRPQKVAGRGSVLVSVRAPVGDVNLAKEDYCIGRGLAAINGGQSLDNWFAFYWLGFAKGRLEGMGTGSTFKSINKGVLENFPIPLLPLPEQRRIAQVLSTIQRVIAAQEDVIAAAKETKRSLMQRLFTYGPGAEPAPTKETEIGEIPEHWGIVTVGEVVDVKGGKRLPKGHKFARSPTDHPYVRVVDFDDNSVSTTDLKFVTPEDYERIKRYTISSEDVYISIAGTTGLVGTIPDGLDRASLTENAAKLVIKDKRRLLKRFLVYALACNRGQKEISQRTTKTSQPKLALMRIKQIPISFPSVAEQQLVVESLSAVSDRIAAEEQRKAALQALFQSMLQQLMTGQVRVPDTMEVA